MYNQLKRNTWASTPDLKSVAHSNKQKAVLVTGTFSRIVITYKSFIVWVKMASTLHRQRWTLLELASSASPGLSLLLCARPAHTRHATRRPQCHQHHTNLKGQPPGCPAPRNMTKARPFTLRVPDSFCLISTVGETAPGPCFLLRAQPTGAGWPGSIPTVYTSVFIPFQS